MAESEAPDRPVYPHEWCWLTLGIACFIWLGSRVGLANIVTIEVGCALAAYLGVMAAAVTLPRARFPKFRLAVSYVFMCWFYFATVRISPALGMPLWDDSLLTFDQYVCGQTPAVYLEAGITPWVTELLSACYLSYHVYLICFLGYALWLPPNQGGRSAGYVLTCFAVGMAGYFLMPAVGPGHAFPELFSTAFSGGPITWLNATLVSAGSSVYDAFPSIHVLVTCVMLDHDWQANRRRFWIFLLPALGMFAATLYLRYHYLADLLAGAALFLILRWPVRRWIDANCRFPTQT